MRDPLDRYYTPRWPTLELLRHLDIERGTSVLEPCAGRGDIATVLTCAGLQVTKGDIDGVTLRRGMPGRRPGQQGIAWDFLGPIDDVHDLMLEHVNPAWIITNPPYTLAGGVKASDFVKRALALAPSVAMLLRANWAEACKDRWELFRDRPPTLIIHLPRVQFHSVGKAMSSNPGHSCWFVWDGDAVATTRTVWADPSCRPPRPKVQRTPRVVAPLRDPGTRRPPQVEHTKGRAMHHTLSLFR